MTLQVPETLIFEGTETHLLRQCYPSLPVDHPEVTILEPDSCEIESTGCHRGYSGTWEIKDGKLYLKSVLSLMGKERLSPHSPVFADWYTGTLKVRHGGIIQHHAYGFESTYERTAHINILSGLVENFVLIENDVVYTPEPEMPEIVTSKWKRFLNVLRFRSN